MQDCDFIGNRADLYLRQLEKAAYEQGVAFKGVFELTPCCNFQCKMCYVHLSPEKIPEVGRERTTEEWIALAEAARQAGVVELTLTGGEVFVRPDFREIYEAIAQMGFLIQIYSNGYLLDEETVQWLSKWPPRAVRFTLYGASDTAYRELCGISEGFSHVRRAVSLLKQYQIPVYLTAMITKENQGEFSAMRQFAGENGITFTHSRQLVNPVRGASADAKAHQVEQELPPPEVREELRKMGSRYPRKPCKDYLHFCGNYRRGFWITWAGTMQLCAFLSEPAVSVTGDSFPQSFQKLCSEVERLRQPVKCDSCQYETYCDRCPGILYAETGDSAKEADSVCQRARYHYAIYGEPF